MYRDDLFSQLPDVITSKIDAFLLSEYQMMALYIRIKLKSRQMADAIECASNPYGEIIYPTNGY